MRLMLLDTRAEQRDVLVILIRPAVVGTALVRPDLLALCAIDAEANVTNKIGSASKSLLGDSEDGRFFPVEFVVAIGDELSSGSRSPCAAPLVVFLRLRLKLRDVERPAINVSVEFGGHLWNFKGKNVALNAGDYGLNPALGFLFLVGHDLKVDAVALL